MAIGRVPKSTVSPRPFEGYTIFSKVDVNNIKHTSKKKNPVFPPQWKTSVLLMDLILFSRVISQMFWELKTTAFFLVSSVLESSSAAKTRRPVIKTEN